MIAVLIVAGILAILIGVWFKRRHDRKWATGGFARETMLSHTEVANALSNRHPDAPPNMSSKSFVPNYDGPADGPLYMSGGAPAAVAPAVIGGQKKHVWADVRGAGVDPEKEEGFYTRKGSKRLSRKI